MPVSLREYHGLAMRTSNSAADHDHALNGIFGLLGETGEIADLYKKWKFQFTPGTEFPKNACINELGDVMWYLEELAEGMEMTLAEVCNDTFDGIDAVVESETAPDPEFSVEHLTRHMCYLASLISWDYEVARRGATVLRMVHIVFDIARLARFCGVTIADVAEANVAKLRHRYPDGFDAHVSMRRSAKEYTE